MKKLILFLFVLLTCFCATAQETTVNNLKQINENNKSGNYKDILTSFFQLATTNFTGKEKTIDMNLTLFAIKAKADPSVLEEEKFINETFSRNFQFNFKLNLDEKYKYKGFTGGATYAIINGRDRKLADFCQTEIPKYHTKLNRELDLIVSDLKIEDKDAKLVDDALDGLMNNKTDNNNPYFSKIKEGYKSKYNTEFESELKKLDTLILSEYKKIDTKPLWTLSVDGTAAEKGKFNKASIGTIFLQGIKDTKCEIDFRSKLVYADTITIAPMPRMDFNAKLAANFKLAKGANNISFFETKIGIEYNSILKNMLPTEKKETFLGNAEIRVRLADDLWLPLIIKYDIEKANFLGFLNLSYNFGSFTTNDKPKKE